MPLTPADVHNVAFKKPPIGKRGYNEDEVDAFLDLVETELARLIEDNNELRQQVEQLDAELESTRSELEAAKAAAAQHGAHDDSSRRLSSVPPASAMEQTQATGLMVDGGEPNVQAAKVLGYGDLRIMATQLLPNMLGPIIVIGTLGMGGAVLAEAALSFLGLGVTQPQASWGGMLQRAQSLTILEGMPWLWLPPGIAIAVTVLAINFVGDGLRDALDPRQQ